MLPMILRRSGFVHLIELEDGSVLAIHAVSQLRLTVTRQVAAVIEASGEAREVDDAVAALATDLAVDAATIRCCMEQLRDRGLLCEEEAAGERDAVARELSPVHGRDPAVRSTAIAAPAGRVHPAWAMGPPDAVRRTDARPLDILLLGDCDVQMEADFLRRKPAAGDRPACRGLLPVRYGLGATGGMMP